MFPEYTNSDHVVIPNTLPHLYPKSHVSRRVYPGTRTKGNLGIMTGMINLDLDYCNLGKMYVGKHVCWETCMLGNMYVGKHVCQVTCIQDKDVVPLAHGHWPMNVPKY